MARIESLWEDASGDKHLEARWYYSPEHTRVGRLRRHHRREVFESTHTDDNSLDTVQCKCAVLSWGEYRAWAAQPAAADGGDDEAERTFVCRGTYNTRTHDIRPLRPAGQDALAEHALAELPLLSDPTAAGGAGAPDGAVPLLACRSGHSPYAEARACLLLNAPPARLPCRENERDKVLRWMRAAVTEGGASSPLYISGVPGTGKTATVREVRHRKARRLPAAREKAAPARALTPPQPCCARRAGLPAAARRGASRRAASVCVRRGERHAAARALARLLAALGGAQRGRGRRARGAQPGQGARQARGPLRRARAARRWPQALPRPVRGAGGGRDRLPRHAKPGTRPQD